jgi:hypothetical protein
MATGPKIVLTASAVSFANEWWNDPSDPNFRILIAGFMFSLIDAAIDQVSPRAASGLGIIMFITVLFTPFNHKSPLQTLASLPVAQPKGK